MSKVTVVETTEETIVEGTEVAIVKVTGANQKGRTST